MSIDKNYTLITGASAGIGKAMAEECARRLQNLILVALPGTGLETVGDFLGSKYKVDVKTLELNLVKPHAISYLYDWCQQQNLRINILINNAGTGNYSSFVSTSLEQYQKMIHLNSATVVSLTKMFVPKLMEHSKSYILNVGSFVSLMSVPYKSVYSATKSFVLAFSRALQSELQQHGVYVSCICPGPTSTETVIKRNKSLGRKSDILMQTPGQVAKLAIDGLLKKKGLIIPGWKNKVILRLGPLLPFRLRSYILESIFKSGIQKQSEEETGSVNLRTSEEEKKCLPPFIGIRSYSNYMFKKNFSEVA
ncbi:SDR family NAD(P)-dependent oxidoreductase [Pontibacter silvestris]|uniref:SDR family NAD(P)-dependent oxidoreductase n=1 Tax=Pontibacter silvestris TaxID=2305183 RepID=A0ABW4X1Q3_9BACT|nr:SDR family oxidoreductase [Pontibacter silvestris]MCC9135092.1 SDR family oxidoreductase [Pontibacter silvestris]